MPVTYQHILEQAYDAFNNRDADAVLQLMAENVHWPNGWEGGYVEGKDAVKAYWLRQWKAINPTVKPTSYKETGPNLVEVHVHQVVKDLDGNLLSDGFVKHVYQFENGLISKMEISNT
ncbi:nuclear transport factor 2 family protein [Danxiaibacter flavus]|uniref:Nuclear transport factor 2 family protein n=1 Tax=Danxiaibacter flavus TaxID=3049108 RepID=A0ABV3Z9H8_9BACT|nr:nuclear transport factor 2 family protein [Chitinophagaceae bacterium DXS]